MNMQIRIAQLGLVAMLCAAACGASKDAGARGELRVGAASDLVFAMADIIPRFEAKTGRKVTFVPGSSGQLAQQIREGAPYDVYFSANVKFVDELIASGDCLADTRALYARGRIAMWAGPDDAPALPATIEGLSDQRYTKIAIAAPEHAPYGAAARQALVRAGVWQAIESRMVYGANIKMTMQFAETGNADVAIIALALAMKAQGKHVLIPEDLHEPIDQALAVCRHGRATEAGRELAAFMKTPEIREIMRSFGFAEPPTAGRE